MPGAPATAARSAPRVQSSFQLPANLARRGRENIQTTVPPEYIARRKQNKKGFQYTEGWRLPRRPSQQFYAGSGVKSFRVVRGSRRDGKTVQGMLEASIVHDLGEIAQAGTNTHDEGRRGNRRRGRYMARQYVGTFLWKFVNQTPPVR